MIKVRLLGHFKSIAKTGEITLQEKSLTVDKLVTLLQQSPGGGELSLDSIIVAVNGVEISALKGPRTVVEEGDEVALIPFVHGG